MRAPPAAVLWCLLLAASCRSDTSSAPRPPGASATGSLSISADPILSLSPQDSSGAPLLGNLADATRLSSGLIAVVDRDIQAVLILDSAGQLVLQAGRRGQGPGEYEAVRGIGQCAPDTLFVWDVSNQRMSVLDAQGTFIRSFALPMAPVAGYCAEAAEFIVWERFLNSTAPGADQPPVRGVANLISAAGERVGSLGELQAGENRPLGAVTQFAPAVNGIWVGTSDTTVIRLLARDGRELGSVSAGEGHRAPSAAEYDAAIAALAATVPGTVDQMAEMRAFLRKRFPPPRYVPAYRALLTNGNGVLFVVTSPLGLGTTDLSVFDASGASLGTLTLPGDVEVVEVGEQYLLGITDDENGNARVVQHGLDIRMEYVSPL